MSFQLRHFRILNCKKRRYNASKSWEILYKTSRHRIDIEELILWMLTFTQFSLVSRDRKHLFLFLKCIPYITYTRTFLLNIIFIGRNINIILLNIFICCKYIIYHSQMSHIFQYCRKKNKYDIHSQYKLECLK